MLWRWPGQLPAGVEHHAPASTLDLHPTLGGAAGAAPDDRLDGIDLLSRLASASSGEAVDEERSLHWECGFQWAIRDGDWKLAWTDPVSPAVGKLRDQEHAPLGEGWHLADLGRDPGEQTNRYDDEPELVARLMARHAAWRAEIGLPPRPVTAT